MLQLFHKYFRSFFLLLMACVVVFSMLFFGTGSSLDASKGYALKINDEEVSHANYYNYQRSYEDRLRSGLGENYSRIFTPDLIKQHVNDAIINATLFRQFSSKLGLAVGDKELTSQIMDKTFMGNREAYQMTLQVKGISAPAYEQMVENDLLSQKIGSLLQLASHASEAEIEAEYKNAETELTLEYAKLDPKDLLEQVKTPEQSEIDSYYNTNASSFETPEMLSYNYVLFEPSKNLALVTVAEEDIQLYYADHIQEYTKPAQAKVSQIKLEYSGALDAIKQSEQKVLADEIFEKAKSGDAFEKLVNTYSQDANSKKNQGSLGWVKPGQLDSSLDQAIFAAKTNGVLAPIVASDGIYIIRIEELTPETTTALETLREIIKAKLQERDAPAFVLSRAAELLKKWKSTDSTLSDLAKTEKLTVQSSQGLLSSGQDPEPSLKGLSRKILEHAGEIRQLVELGDNVFLVETIEHKAIGIPTLAEVQAQIVDTLKDKAAQVMAKKKAQELLAQITSTANNKAATKTVDFAEKCQKLGLTVAKIESLKQKEPGQDFASTNQNKEQIFAAGKLGVIPSVLEHDNRYYLVAVKEIRTPEVKPENLKSYRESTETTNLEILSRTLLNHLKLNSEIEIDPAYGSVS